MLPKLSSSSSFNSYLSNLFVSENDMPMVRRSLDVDAEYTEAFHTKSFLNIWAEAHEQPKPTPSPTNFQHNSNSCPLPNFLLEPTQSSLLAAAAASGGGAALFDYLDATLQSSSACALLLTAISRTRSIDRSVRRHLHRHACGGSAAADLSAYIDLGNPLSSQNLSPFHRTHSLYPPLLARLTEERRRIRRAARAVLAAKKAAGIIIIAAVGTAAVAAAVILAHAAAAVVAAAAVPALSAGCRRRWRRWVSVKWMETAGRKVDAAARGAYIVGRDMDTVSRMVRRVHDEVEHRRDVVRLMLRSGEGEMAREVVRELEMGEVGFEEQIEELEEHVYLCLLTINRSRRLVHG
ncbi:hypothetical protein IEQ34_015508 [Dendrobium chrysotoxum]|uniref:Uncharacterized protein n=1 Tax=Dendrobium chrysotoxum TaxID=161865 RepID=A0AAV7GG44_DENCH|nr:hypothetical protein IEQ34_015508 [Dendrobium chrysotoxum]